MRRITLKVANSFFSASGLTSKGYLAETLHDDKILARQRPHSLVLLVQHQIVYDNSSHFDGAPNVDAARWKFHGLLTLQSLDKQNSQ
jgi:hypothetical protein